MKLKTKLSLSISVLVLVLVLAVSMLYLTSLLHEQVQDVATVSDLVAKAVFADLREEIDSERQAGKLDTSRAEQVESFMAGLGTSPALNTVLDWAVDYSPNVRDVGLLNTSGVVVADSNPLLIGHPLPARASLEQVSQGTLSQQYKAIFGGERTYETILPLRLGDKPLGSIRVGVDTALVRSALQERLRSVFIWGVLVVIVSTFLSIAFSDFALSPLTALSAQLDHLTGSTAPSEDTGGTDEFGVVSSKIQQLGRQIQDARQVYSTLQENVAQVLETLEEGLVFFDADGRAVMASAAAHKFLGLEPVDIIRRSVDEVFPGDSTLDRAVRTAIHHRLPLATREVQRRPGGPTLLARLDILGESSRILGALLTLRDAERVHRLEDIVDVARRMSAIGRLTRGVAHEVKNPLNAMAIHLDLLREKSKNGSDQAIEQHVEIIRKEIDRLDRVVKTFLDFTRPSELQLREVDLVEIAATVRDLASPSAEVEGVKVELAAAEPSLIAWADRDLVEQALLNLVNNGIQAMVSDHSGDGNVVRATENGNAAPLIGANSASFASSISPGANSSNLASPGANAASLASQGANSSNLLLPGAKSSDFASPAANSSRLRIEVAREGEHAVVRVHDHGAGIPPEIRDRIFDLYFSTRAEGTGIGLALTARIMQLHNGAVELESSRPGEGTTFALRFPLRVGTEVSR